MIRFLLLILVLASSPLAEASPCRSRLGHCDYYACLGEQLECAEKSRIVHLAGPYCQRFENRLEHFSPQGQATLKKIKICLQHEVEKAHSNTCDEAGEDFVQAHVDCYLSLGFCDLSFIEKLRIGAIAWRTLGDRGFRHAAFTIEKTCLRRHPNADVRPTLMWPDAP